MASVTLESLPVELIEEIVAWLDFHDHCALRLTGRTISVKSSNAAFRNYFLSKKLEVAEAPLEQFVGITQPGRFGLWVQDLTLYAPPSQSYVEDEDTGELFPINPRIIELLAQGFENIRDNSPHDEPLSITLRILGEGVKRNAAARVFRVTLSALRSTGLSVLSLDGFADGFYHRPVGHGSFPISEFPEALYGGSTADLNRLATTFHTCRKIRLGLAHDIYKFDSESVREFNFSRNRLFELPPSYEEARESTRSLSEFLNLCAPTLEELHLSWESDPFEDTAGVVENTYFFRRVQESCRFSILKRCTLCHLHMSEATLLAFFHPLTRLEYIRLDYISIDGEYDEFFRLLSTTMPELNYLRLQSMFDATGVLRYPGEPRENRIPRPKNILRFPGIIRTGADARRLVVGR
ncbi:uncharacterized protein BO88DRAFT_373599 [Aspergillus vadensis CBS 113365]|uniref:F-box domain-containing protein n=1 Tax=Aspergillus vadensis (strain CBS 113365 / IMI 142717 / IBT 24658) TaxID=1448311 RepID=A0A319BNJ7_ASPVC|nr:hypothetical protein BO88DRAFT_373599 [Aspergillus vadensis CBS 113365]PYH64778.1 hypothetical protein BO88DRAFT_373599 [Aspergillus vadensis CBS 113365]